MHRFECCPSNPAPRFAAVRRRLQMREHRRGALPLVLTHRCVGRATAVSARRHRLPLGRRRRARSQVSTPFGAARTTRALRRVQYRHRLHRQSRRGTKCDSVTFRRLGAAQTGGGCVCPIIAPRSPVMATQLLCPSTAGRFGCTDYFFPFVFCFRIFAGVALRCLRRLCGKTRCFRMQI